MKYLLNNKVNILEGLNHPNIIKYYNSFKKKSKLFIIMEYAKGGDLKKLINTNKNNSTLIDEKLARFF
jgi:serine/threonine protein kinase